MPHDVMQLPDLISEIIRLPAFAELVAAIEAGTPPTQLGLARAARLPVVAALQQATGRPVVLITDRTDRSFTFVDELALWAEEIRRLHFPEPNPIFYEQSSWGEGTRRDRLLGLATLSAYNHPVESRRREDTPPPILVTAARAMMTRTLPLRDFLRATHTLRPGQQVQPEELLRRWVAIGYAPVTTVVAPGQFARRGGILDIWPPADDRPYRLDFFGDEIDTLRPFNPETQRTGDVTGQETASPRVLITPAREFVLGQTQIQGLHLGPLAASPESVILEQLESGENLADLAPSIDEGRGISEFHIPYLHPTPAGLIDYIPPQAIILVDNWEALTDMVSELEAQAISLREDSLSAGRLAEDYPLPYLTWDQIQDSLSSHQVIRLGPKTGEPHELSLSARFSPNPRFGGQLKPLLSYLSQVLERGEKLLVVSRQAGRLRQLWHEQTPFSGPEAKLAFVQASLSEGWQLAVEPHGLYHLLTDGEIFGWRRPQPRQRQRVVKEAPESSYADLQEGDWVVHVDHGVGRFRGLVQRVIDGTEREYLCVAYAQGDQLFVPVHQADRLTRFIGPDSRPPRLTRLGGIEWHNVKKRVQKAVEDVAEDLLALYARRQAVQGYAFSPDTSWQKELEASFPYIETEDQVRVIEEVKRDMESPLPMDRLICGDVGYGKTEVALRAAFKAVLDHRQVAILVPTTILAQQHFHTFRQRLAAFPVEVEMLSRFRSPAQQQQILERLAEGTVDIVIGTHRLLQGDVSFKDLGLLIIDEEQRFGVTHKEVLKQMRVEVDVLTMTATPIPRTMYMALTGVRDISMITTPPEERLPIITHVGPFSKRLVRQAILREMDRGGQVFFVHNRVQTIGAIRDQLRGLVPEARMSIAHGQMAEQQLASRMEDFNAGEIDVLLTTTIIESGLDIPNANTLIVDRADTFGLAQLYQLRGRVGRGAQRAYAYFLRHKRRPPTDEGRQRLETIAENTQLGAGFSIAMRDMEIRGAGDILGTRQHGHIAAVGFHLYTRLLADAVRRLRGDRAGPPGLQTVQLDVPTLISVDLPLAINIPPDYIPDQGMRLRLYRRLADLRELAEVDALEAEFSDRFGPPPEPVQNLFFQLQVKILADAAGLASIGNMNGQIVLRYTPLPEDAPRRVFPDMGPLVRTSKNAIWIARSAADDWPDLLLETLLKLSQQDGHLP